MARKTILQTVEEDLRLNISNEKSQKIRDVLEPFLFTDSMVCRVRNTYEEEIKLGLAKNPEKESSLQMANTFIPSHLTGSEKGDFLALDLGGTNFRVILLELEPGKELQCNVKYYTVPEELRLGEGELLFEFLADCIAHFLNSNGLLGRKLPLGFCFSFPMIQTGIDAGILVTWTKTFKCKNVVGHEVVEMLRKALAKREGVDVEVIAVINDTTGTLMMGSYLDKRSAIGLILGTGCNACYFEKINKIEKWDGDHAGINEVIIDTEMGAFGDNGALDYFKTEFDKKVDDGSLLVKSFTFEKLFAGRYVGEIVRQILLHLIDNNLLFDNVKTLPSKWIVTAADVSNIVESGVTEVAKIFQQKEFSTLTADDLETIHYVCNVVSIRGALLVSICLACLLDRMEKEDATIAVDGSLFKLHPKYKKHMEKFIATLAPKRKFQLILAEDGSGKGAGLVAAVVTSLDKSKLHV